MILAQLTVSDWIQLVIAIPVGFTFVWGSLKAIYAVSLIIRTLSLVIKEMRPNGGSSMKDRIAMLERTQHDQITRLERIEKKIDVQKTVHDTKEIKDGK